MGEHIHAVADAAIEMADGAIVLGARHQPALRHGAVIVGRVEEFRGVAEFLALGALEKDEMVEDAAREAGQFDDDAGGMVAGRDGEVRPRQMRAGTDRHHQVAGEGQVGHLLDGDRGDGIAPALDRRCLLGCKPVALAALEAPGGVEIAAHEVVLDGRSLGEQIDQLLARLDADFRFFLRHSFHTSSARQLWHRRPGGATPPGSGGSGPRLWRRSQRPGGRWRSKESFAGSVPSRSSPC
jgi:hypothetical protein